MYVHTNNFREIRVKTFNISVENEPLIRYYKLSFINRDVTFFRYQPPAR